MTTIFAMLTLNVFEGVGFFGRRFADAYLFLYADSHTHTVFRGHFCDVMSVFNSRWSRLLALPCAEIS